GGPQERVEIADRLLDGLVRGSGITPCEPGPIVGANPGGISDFRLYESPVDGKRAPARHQDDGWTTLAGAVEGELAAANDDQSAGGRISLRQRLVIGLITSAGEAHEQHRGAKSPERQPHPT